MSAPANRPPLADPPTAATWLAAIVESSDDAIIGKDLSGIIHSWNRGAEKIFGYTAAEIVGTSITRLIPPDRLDEEKFILDKVGRGERVDHFETRRLTKTGRELDISLTVSPIRDASGRIAGVSKIARDITKLKEKERELARMSRLYSALSQINQAIVWMPTRDELLRKICQVLVEHGGFKLAWISWHDATLHRLAPVASFGAGDDYVEKIQVYSDDRPEGLGPSGQAFREERPYICNDLLNDPTTLPWRAEMLRHGFRASAVFPIRCQNRVVGTLNVYGDELDFFGEKEIALLTEAAGDISFGLDNFVRNEERRRSEESVRAERDFSTAIINSLPGVLYLYDRSGRFLRWNDNLERVTGYSGAELAQLHPLDLFPAADRDRVAERIEDVFAHGESCVEASFLTKDGRMLPYFFTGNAIQFDGRSCLIGVGIDIGDRVLAEEALRASESRYHTLFEQAPDGILIADRQSTYLDANASICRMLGYTHRELVGMHASDIVAPEEITHIGETLGAIKTRSAYQREWRFRRKDGSVFPAEVIATVMPDGNLMGMIRDITARRQAEVQLAESEQKYRELVELANSIILRWNSAGEITFLNEFGQRFFGYTPDEILGRHVVGTIIPANDDAGPKLKRLIAQICTAPETFDKSANENMRRNGERVWIAWTNRILRDPVHGGAEILSVGTDITKQREAETALRELNENLEQRVVQRTAEMQAAVERAKAADQIKSAFLATMSHELRTPLNSIIGFTGLVLQGLAGPLNAEQSKQLGMVRGSARHLLELINDVLDISKIEAGQLEVRAEPFDLPASIERVVASVRPLAEKKNLTLTSTLDPSLGEMLNDRRRTEQILINLLNNAVKFTERGAVTLTAERIADYQRSPDDKPVTAIRIQVSDTGIGIKPEHLPALFQPFHQIDSGLTRSHEGTGLGLVICRRLAVLMGGAISVASEWQRGSVFTVILPLRKSLTP